MIIPLLLMLSQDKAKCCCGDMAQFASDPAFVAAHAAPVAIHFKPLEGKQISIPDANGKPAGAFYVPPAKGSKVAIIMIHEFWGLNDHIKKEAEHMHDETGYAVLAVDLYEGKIATDPKVASEYMGAVDQVRATAIVKGAVTDLKNGSLGFKPAKIGTVGYCFGGGWSHRAAIQGGPAVNACVIYYGMPDIAPADLAKLKAPVLMMHAMKDQWINDKVVAGFQKAMKDTHHPLQVLHFNAAHAFANPSNPAYDKPSAEKANQATLAFFKKHLG